MSEKQDINHYWNVCNADVPEMPANEISPDEFESSKEDVFRKSMSHLFVKWSATPGPEGISDGRNCLREKIVPSIYSESGISVAACLDLNRNTILRLREFEQWCTSAGIGEVELRNSEAIKSPRGAFMLSLRAWIEGFIGRGGAVYLTGLHPGLIFNRSGDAEKYCFLKTHRGWAIVPEPGPINILSRRFLRLKEYQHNELLNAAARIDGQNILSLVLLLEGFRDAARLRYFSEGEKVRLTDMLAKGGFYAVTNAIGKTGTLSSRLGEQDALGTLPINFMYVGRTDETCRAAARADVEGRHDELGAMYGYPECCVRKNSLARSAGCRFNIDYIHRIVMNTAPGRRFHFMMNPVHNYYMLHFPCSLDCGPSGEMAAGIYDFYREYYPAMNGYAACRQRGSLFISPKHIVYSRKHPAPGDVTDLKEFRFLSGNPPRKGKFVFAVNRENIDMRIGNEVLSTGRIIDFY